MRAALLSWDSSGPLDGIAGEPISATAPLRALEALRARRGFEPGMTAMPFMAAALRRVDADIVHAFTLADAVVAARSGLPAAFSFPWVPSRATVAARRGRLALLEEALHGCVVLASDDATAAGLARWLGANAPVARHPFDIAAVHADLGAQVMAACTLGPRPPT